jgi:hypothetical protein
VIDRRIARPGYIESDPVISAPASFWAESARLNQHSPPSIGFFSFALRFSLQSAAVFVRNILTDPAITVREQSASSFLSGLSLYESRPDKAYSLTDCISMQAMRQTAIPDILTADDHFVQEGFVKLL